MKVNGDSKDGELCLDRVKLDEALVEALVEAHSGSDG